MNENARRTSYQASAWLSRVFLDYSVAPPLRGMREHYSHYNSLSIEATTELLINPNSLFEYSTYSLVNRLHFRPKTPPPSPPSPSPPDEYQTVSLDTPLVAELPSATLGDFTTSEFTLGELYGDSLLHQDADNSGSSLDVNGDDLLNENLGLLLFG